MEASDILKKLGLVLPFEEGLTDMANQELRVSQIFHKSFIEINEKGTESAAATGAIMMSFCGAGPIEPPPVVDFVADHPFLFLIREDINGSVLFMGTVVNPVTCLSLAKPLAAV
ncbi:OLC1v1019533C1 [Oldenlandia corymbosa var. corymbosa]|nr:OLC1v1019533C1 [Oldenlandia corymbosa var. corymbosa]